MLDGWQGLIDGRVSELGLREVSGILPRGGTIIGTSADESRTACEGGVDSVLRNFAAQRLDGLVAVGGEDTLGVAQSLWAEHDLPVVGVPKTIDNDLSATDYTFGFDTAVAVCTEAIDRLHTTAESHNRVMVVEVMGRYTGWIAVMSGIAGGADVILIPEHPLTVEETCAELESRHRRKDFSIIVVSEGYTLHVRVRRGAGRRAGADAPTSSGTCAWAASAPSWPRRSRSAPGSRRATPCSGTSSAAARPPPAIACWRRASACARPISCTKGASGTMAALHGDAIVDVPLADAVAERKTVPRDWYAVARAFFG